MMEDLFNVDLDFNLDLGVDTGNDLDFLPEDLFNFIDDDLHEDLREIAENDIIPNIESLINFNDDDQLGDVQWDDLDTTDFFTNVQCQLPTAVTESNQTQHTLTKSPQAKQSRSSKQNKQQPNYVENVVLSPSSTSPNSPTASYSTETSSNDSTDFVDMFENYYSLDSNNNLISHPITSLSIDEISKLNDTCSQQSYSFDLSNNFGGFVNVQSALSLVNGAVQPKLVAGKQLIKRKRSKGTSLLAGKPKSYKAIKREMLQKRCVLPNKSQHLTNSSRLKSNAIAKCEPAAAATTISMQIVRLNNEPLIEEPIFNEQLFNEQIFSEQIVDASQQQPQLITSTYAQDHDYCFNNSIDSTLHS